MREKKRLENVLATEADLIRRAAALAGVDAFVGQHTVFPCGFPAARTGHDVVEAALLRAQHAARVLTAVAIALANERRYVGATMIDRFAGQKPLTESQQLLTRLRFGDGDATITRKFFEG